MIEKIKAEIERLKKNLPWGGSAAQLAMECNCKYEAYDEILRFIESLEEERPHGLDDAAEEYARTTFTRPLSDTPEEQITIIEPDKLAGFKAGAKWMAEQGMNIDATIKEYRDVSVIDWSDDINISAIIRDRFNAGDKVIVQIRKKEE